MPWHEKSIWLSSTLVQEESITAELPFRPTHGRKYIEVGNFDGLHRRRFFFFFAALGREWRSTQWAKKWKKRYHVMRNSSCHHEKNVFCWWYHEEFIMISWGIAHYVILPYDLVRIRWSLHTMSKLKKKFRSLQIIRNSIFGDLNLFQNAIRQIICW